MEDFRESAGRLPTYPCTRRPPMDDQILAIYCVCHDFLKALHHREDRQQKMTAAEVMTTALVAMFFFGGNFEISLANELTILPKAAPMMIPTARSTTLPR